MFASIGFVFGIFAIADDFVPIFFGNDFLKTALLLKIMPLLVVITSVTFVIEYEYLIPAGKRNKINKFVILGAISNLILNFILIRKFASIGAVIASIVAELIVMIGFYFTCDKIVSPLQILSSMKNKLIAGLVMTLSIYSLKYILNMLSIGNGILNLSLQIIIGGLIYLLVLYLLKDPVINFKKELDNI
jgi:O-antigen/teichoic acid export membrane protein